MPPEIIALLGKPWMLAALLAVGAACGMFAERIAEQISRARKREYWRKRNERSGQAKSTFQSRMKMVPLKGTPERKTFDAAEQLRIVMESEFSARPLLNKPERRLLAHLDRILAEETPGWRAMGQVSLGEILTSENDEAFLAINSKRVDLLIIDADSHPLHAVEFQGTGHHLAKNTAARDAVKKEALRRAGIGYLDIQNGDTPADLRAKVQKLAGRS